MQLAAMMDTVCWSAPIQPLQVGVRVGEHTRAFNILFGEGWGEGRI